MSLQINKINGKNPFLDYDNFHKSTIDFLKNTCHEAEIYILNNFPVPISPRSNLDLLIFIKIPDGNKNYLKLNTKNDSFYLKNKIFAISIIPEFNSSKVEIENDNIIINEGIVNFDSDSEALKWGLINYLSSSCNMNRNEITVHPITWIINSCNYLNSEVIINDALSFENIIKCMLLQPFAHGYGYLNWKRNELTFSIGIRQIIEQASMDSETGYITKEKIKRIQNKLEITLKKYNNYIGTGLVEISGKAGTGKSSDLLNLMLKGSIPIEEFNGRKGILLTYNHLLVFEHTKLIRSFSNKLPDDIYLKRKLVSCNTIQSFFFNTAKILGVLTLMTKNRAEALLFTHKKYMNSVIQYIKAEFIKEGPYESEISIEKLKSRVHQASLSKEVKKQALEFLYFSKKTNTFLHNGDKLVSLQNDFYEFQKGNIINLLQKEIFLKDYHNVLKNILKALNNFDEFFKEMDVENSFDFLEIPMKLRKESILNIEGKITSSSFYKRFHKGISGIRYGRTLFVDEAQDCHKSEREILYYIFGPKNVVIVNGGKEQLIRYNEICDWHSFNRTRLTVPIFTYKKIKESYRMKPTIAAFANYLSTHFQIDLGVLPQETEDKGRIIIRNNVSDERAIKDIQDLNSWGITHGCSSYESLILMCPFQDENTSDSSDSVDTYIDEDDIIRSNYTKKRGMWKLIELAQKEISQFRFWNTTGFIDKRELEIPGELSVRSINYESSRGIEAWSVMCFGIDLFFENKMTEKDADFYMLDDVFLTTDERKRLYAATWVLMAITRPIDTLYLELRNKESILSKIILEFARLYPNYVEFEK